MCLFMPDLVSIRLGLRLSCSGSVRYRGRSRRRTENPFPVTSVPVGSSALTGLLNSNRRRRRLA